MEDPNFWNDRRRSEEIINEVNAITSILDGFSSLKEDIETYLEMAKIVLPDDKETLLLLESEIDSVQKRLDDIEIKVLLNGEYDKNDAIMEIHSGAGGTEACDWADMIYRMYTRWATSKNYKIEVLDRQDGLEVGIKSLTMLIKGPFAYGYLKNENGINRLVRI